MAACPSAEPTTGLCLWICALHFVRLALLLCTKSELRLFMPTHAYRVSWMQLLQFLAPYAWAKAHALIGNTCSHGGDSVGRSEAAGMKKVVVE
eukprot:scaffold199503_cov23-Tisochrysis_lutea.AAC.1